MYGKQQLGSYEIEFESSYGVSIEELRGVVLADVFRVDRGGDAIVFVGQGGRVWVLYHSQDCCESVYIEDIVGDLQDLIGEPLLQAEVRISETPEDGVMPEYTDDAMQWTFYAFATVKGSVDVRWFGSSNGYYSVSVDLARGKLLGSN